MSAQPSAESPIPAQAAERAVEWLIDLQAPEVSASLRRQWHEWRAAHPDHERAWQRIESINGKLNHLASSASASAAHAALEGPASRDRRKALQVLSLLLFGGSVWTVREHAPWREWTADVRSAIGEYRTLTLDDGTTLSLNTDSAIDLRYSATERRLVMIAGEVLIVTAKDRAQRPLLVSTPQGTAEALGTRFTVRQIEAATRLAVYEGAVRVRPSGITATTIVRAGEQVTFTRTNIGPIGAADVAAVAWTQGILVAKGMRLADLLVELGRHTPHALSCAPDIADLRVSGSYPLSNTDGALQAIAEIFSLRTQTVTRFWGQQAVHLSRARPEDSPRSYEDRPM